MASEGGEGAARPGLTRKCGTSASPEGQLEFGKRGRCGEEPGGLFHPQKAGGVAGWKSSPQRFGFIFFLLQFGGFSLQKLLNVRVNPRVDIRWKLFSKRQTQRPASPWSGFLFPDSELSHSLFFPEFQLSSRARFAPAVCQAADFEAQRPPRHCS